MPRVKGPGSGGARGGEGEPVWSRTRPSKAGDPGRTAPGAASGRFAPDGLDDLRLGRPKLHMSVRTARILAAAQIVLGATPLLIDLAMSLSSGPLPWIAPFGLAMGASLLASCRCERDVHAGRHAAWAYPWDWIQLLFLPVTSVAIWAHRRDAFSFGFAGLVALTFALAVRAMLLRRRRARAVWTTDAVRDTFE